MSSGKIYSLVIFTESSKLTFFVRLTTRDIYWLLLHLVLLVLILLSLVDYFSRCVLSVLPFCYFAVHKKIFPHNVCNTFSHPHTSANSQCAKRLMQVNKKKPCRTSASCKLVFWNATYNGKKITREMVKMYGKATSGKKLAVSLSKCMLYVINGKRYGDTV